MFESLKNVDWNLLHQQKLVLLAMRKQCCNDSPKADALSGIIHLLDALQDDAAARGLWVFPGERKSKGGA